MKNFVSAAELSKTLIIFLLIFFFVTALNIRSNGWSNYIEVLHELRYLQCVFRPRFDVPPSHITLTHPRALLLSVVTIVMYYCFLTSKNISRLTAEFLIKISLI